MEAPRPADEFERLRALRELDILDTADDPILDGLARVAARILEVPIALVSIVDAERQWFKSCIGLDTRETGRDLAFCAYTILQEGPLIVLDPENDPRFADNALVTAAPFIRFYVGAPLVLSNGKKLGTLCMIDTVKREAPSPEQLRDLVDLANTVAAVLEQKNSMDRLWIEIQERKKAEAKAEAANLAKTAFLSRMSHELRTPLTAVMGFTDLLLMDELSGDQLECAQHISSAAKHLLSLINEVIELSALESGYSDVVTEEVDLQLVIGSCAQMVAPLANTAGVTLKVHPSDDLFVKADERRVKQVVLNLLSNAIKYNASGGTVCVTTTSEDGNVRIAVQDDGIGISAEAAERIFDPLYRAPNGQLKPGTGLGLALCKNLIEAMDGAIAVGSQIDEGTCFSFTLPVCNTGSALVGAN